MQRKNTAPFYPQSWNLDQWRELGFKSYEDAEYWQYSSCGILCLKMAINSLKQSDTGSMAEYVSLGQKLEAYTNRLGWIHDGLVRMAHHFGVEGIVKENLTIDQLKKYIDQGCFPIISIKWAFQDTKTLKERIFFWKKYGGHMALIVGYAKGKENGFFIHHTSVRQEYNWQYKFIDLEAFKKGFTGRGVIICSQFNESI